jgi:hypothetical protein
MVAFFGVQVVLWTIFADPCVPLPYSRHSFLLWVGCRSDRFDVEFARGDAHLQLSPLILV